MVPSSCSPAWSRRGFFSDIYSGNLLKLLEENLVGTFLGQHPSGAFNCQNCPRKASSSLSGTGQGFLLPPRLPHSGSSDSWTLPLSNLGGPGWLVSPLFYGSKKSCWHFHLCSFWLVRMGSGNFHTPSMQNQRLEAFSVHRIPSWLSRAVSDFRVQPTPHMEKPERRTLFSCLLLYLETDPQYSNVFPFCLSVPTRLANTLLFSRLLGTISHFECDLYPTFRWEKKINCKMFSHISKSFAFLGNFFP